MNRGILLDFYPEKLKLRVFTGDIDFNIRNSSEIFEVARFDSVHKYTSAPSFLESCRIFSLFQFRFSKARTNILFLSDF